MKFAELHYQRGRGPVLALWVLVMQSLSLALTPFDFITVGNIGNASDSTGYGRVDYAYRIGKYEVSLNQYASFLNAVAASDTYNLYNTQLGTDLNVAGITRSGSPGSYSYTVIGDGSRPVTYVSWFDAARMANWMHNGEPTGSQDLSTTEAGAYPLSGATSGIINRNPGARVYLPSEDEWYKAAYHDPSLNGGTGGYWLYPMRSNTTPGNQIGSLPNQANYYTASSAPFGLLSVTQQNTTNSSQNYLTAGGAFSASASAHGTFDQAGNVYEVLDASSGSNRIIRGGTWWANNSGALLQMQGAGRNQIAPATENNVFGFRLAGSSSPEIEVMHSEVNLIDGDSTLDFGSVIIGTQGIIPLIIRNTGTGPLTISGATLDGAQGAEFGTNLVPPVIIAAAQEIQILVSFVPAGSSTGTRAASLHFANSDVDEGVFDLALTGVAYSPTTDFDNDGLNDAAEYKLAALGFDWQTDQTALVTTLFSGANSAGLYSNTQVQELNVGTPLLTRNATTGAFKLTLGIQKSANLINFTPFPMTVPQIQLNAQGELEFEFTSTDNAAFYRLQAK
ncbi:MAG: SUMF1/EgtB/PvdO family nonheme iron enzyme [Verrucomicrobiaceae bacterium]|nr:SUMF1/EgtB/PvdO family nonheme iron enzyme [Verrucomicrobiaceae bacterium]